MESNSAGAAVWAGGGRIAAIDAPRLEIPSLTPDGGSFASAVEVYVHVPPQASFLAYTIGGASPPPACTSDDKLSARFERTKEGSGDNPESLLLEIIPPEPSGRYHLWRSLSKFKRVGNSWPLILESAQRVSEES